MKTLNKLSLSLLASTIFLSFSTGVASQETAESTLNDAWKNARFIDAGEVTANPDPYTGKTYIFEGALRKYDPVKMRFIICTSPELPVIYESFFESASGSQEGRSKIRSMAHAADRFGGCSYKKFLYLGVIKQYSNTFEAYLDITDVRPAPKKHPSSNYRQSSSVSDTQPSRPSSSSQPNEKTASPRTESPRTNHGSSSVPALAEIETAYPESTYFAEQTMSFDVDASTAWGELIGVLKKEKFSMKEVDEGKKVIVTESSKYGTIFKKRWRRFIAVLEDESNGKSKLVFKILHYEPVYNNSNKGKLEPFTSSEYWIIHYDDELTAEIKKHFR